MEETEDEEIGSLYSVEVVIDANTLNKIRSKENECDFFFIFWLSSQETKAVIPKNSWSEFHKAIKESLKNMEETYKGVMGFYRGIVTPYRTKYAEEAGIKLSEEEKKGDGVENDEASSIAKIVNRHYATVRYLIVEDPKIYIKMREERKLRINPENITTLDGFYELIATKDSNCASEFKNIYGRTLIPV